MKGLPLLATLILGACVGCGTPAANSPTVSVIEEVVTAEAIPDENAQVPGTESFARVEAVEVRQDTFAVTIRSPDTGCDRYADWWEVLTEDGELLYRRVLAHSHVREQPFIRSGGPVQLTASQVAIVRAHMHPAGYGTQAMRGTIATGFAAIDLPKGFAAAAATEEPQPPPCTF